MIAGRHPHRPALPDPMDETNQTYLPESFVALYQSAPGRRPVLGRAELSARHEFCEDLATLMTDQCRTVLFRDGLSEDVVLERCLQGLQAMPDTLGAAEAWWVVNRTAELLGWDCPPFERPPFEAPTA